MTGRPYPHPSPVYTIRLQTGGQELTRNRQDLMPVGSAEGVFLPDNSANTTVYSGDNESKSDGELVIIDAPEASARPHPIPTSRQIPTQVSPPVPVPRRTLRVTAGRHSNLNRQPRSVV